MIIHESSVMRASQHQFGVDSQVPHTALVLDKNTKMVSFGGMKQKYPNGLAEAMEERGIGQAALAKKAGTSQQQINKLVHGEREMTASWAERLAPLLLVAPETLVFPALKRIRVPLISWVTASRLSPQEGVRKADIKKWILASDLPKGDWIALQVDGDSMNLVAPDGAIILANCSNLRLVNDAFYVFTTDQGETTFKRYRQDSRGIRLQPYSTNPDHETIFPKENLSVVGRVGRVVTDLL